MHNQTSIQLLEPVRARLAEQMAAFERQHGPVTTTPIQARAEGASYNGRAVSDAKARKRGAATQRKQPPLPLAKRGTRQAKQQAVLREVWP
ncbi:hypothetical protein [Pseudomonas sp. B392_1p]|uniref:hypothetical protein n=1 Tax=Pseudomonas sp. B392_1p TaxID=3457507 RepID=UPI003FD69C87